MELYKYIHEHLARTVGFQKTKRELTDLERANKNFGTTHGRITKVMGTNIKQTIQRNRKWGTVYQRVSRDYQTESGKVIRTVQRQRLVGNQWATGQERINKITHTSTKRMGDFQRALRRVAIVVPMWMLFRTVLMGTLRTLTQGMKYWENFDKSMMKTKAVIHGITGDLNVVIKDLEERITSLSMETGISMDKISSAFYRFGTVGLSFEESWEGAIVSVKTAMAMMGDADKIARVLAIAYKLLGDTIDKSIPVNKRMESIGAKLYKLWRINAFEIDEFTGALERFIPTANTANFSLDQTVALLATLHSAGLKGTRAGRLLRSSIDKLVANLDKLAVTLKIGVDPMMENTFEVFMRVLGLNKT